MEVCSASGPVERAFVRFEQMSPDMRLCVCEYGQHIVEVLVKNGIRDPRRIREVMREIWHGPRGPGQRIHGVGVGARPLHNLDAVLLQHDCAISAATLVRILADNSLVIVPRDPSPAMVAASMDATNHMGVVSKTQKHTNRLRAAIKAAIKQLWPHLEGRS